VSDQSDKDEELRRLAATLREKSIANGLSHAAFYFTFLGDHFVAQARATEDGRLRRVSPFVYTMQ